jgi:hypothetical protein
MTQDWNKPPEPTPRQLAAYADDQLQGNERAQVEGWLAEHPDCATEVESYRRLAQLWDTTSAPEPAPAAWDRTLERIKHRLPPSRRSFLALIWGGMGGLAAVAAVFLAVLLSRAPGPGLPVPVPAVETSEPVPFPVASPNDVTIISMDVADIDMLVVGEPPVQLRDMTLARLEDVKLVGLNDPEIRLEEWVTPMIVDPQAVAPSERDR